MDPTTRRAAWDRINERLQYVKKPYINEANTKGGGFPVHWVPVVLVVIAVISVIRGW